MSEQKLHRITFGSRHIRYELSHTKRKTLGIKVFPDCSVYVVAPLGTSAEKAAAKVREKAPWILKQQNDFLAYHPITPARKFVNGETHFYLGRQYRLTIKKANQNEVEIIRGRIIIRAKQTEDAKVLLTKWYKERAREHFAKVIRQQLPKFNRYIHHEPRLQILSMKTRWGSCTAKGKIILNPELIKAPKGSIEYVVIHELCHLVHRNHTKAFYNLQERIMPDCARWKERLEKLLA